MSDQIDLETQTGWLSPEELDVTRGRVPMVYVDMVPVRVDGAGVVEEIALLLRFQADGSVSRSLVSGRVLYGEQIRQAMMRHLERDLGPLALPRLPPEPAPFTVVEYFPDPDRTGFYDPRQHAVSLAYVVPIDGTCEPSQDSLDLAWVTPEEAVSPETRAEMSNGHDRLVRRALAYVGRLP